MNKLELKSNLHDIVDQLENIDVLKKYYNELKKWVSGSATNMWDRLSVEEQQEVLHSFEESDSDENLIDNATAIKKLKKHL